MCFVFNSLPARPAPCTSARSTNNSSRDGAFSQSHPETPVYAGSVSCPVVSPLSRNEITTQPTKRAHSLAPLLRFFLLVSCRLLASLSCWPRLGCICAGRRGRCLHWRLFAVRSSGGCRGVAVRAGICARIARCGNFHLLAQSVFELLANVRIFLQENARILAALPHALPAEA